MTPLTATTSGHGSLRGAAEQGRVCALATECLRDLQDCAAAYPELFPAGPFGPTVFSGVALASAFSSPEATMERIRIGARTIIWAFALDWLLDRVATSRDEIDALIRGCLAVAGGAPPAGDAPLQRFLADIRDELATRDGWPELSPVWRGHLERHLLAGAREWDWKAAHRSGDRTALPTLDEYLANADNLGSTFVNVTHWIGGGHAGTADRLERPAAVSDEVQRALRLLNDLATYERDVAWGDLNSLLLGVPRAEVVRRAERLVDDCERLIDELHAAFPEQADYLRRQLGYSIGFYGTTDYWGAL